MADASMLERLLSRSRTIVIVALAILCGFAWIYILGGAGLHTSAWSMTQFALFPHRHATDMQQMAPMVMPMAEPSSSISSWALLVAMWWTMMVAMMTPSAAPAILLYGKVQRHSADRDGGAVRLASVGAFAGGYLLTWLAFSIIAAAIHWLLVKIGDVSATMMDSQSRWLSASVLVLAGIYQQSRLKNACLLHCRSPASFLSRHWRPGTRGALRLGMLHGAHCVGCCWALMALLFVGGVMNLVWIAVLTVVVLMEKLLPGGHWASHATGVLLIAWGLATLYV